MIKLTISKKNANDLLKQLEGMATQKDKNAIAESVANAGVAIARQKYMSTNVEVGKTRAKAGECKVYARAKGLFYTEYGTGLIGKGTYPDDSKLPKETRKFESPKGVPQTTQGWEYYYPNPDTKEYGGWWYGEDYKQFTQGQPAGAQMFHAAQELRKITPEIVKKRIKEAGKVDVSVS